jgi:hypothetical protein
MDSKEEEMSNFLKEQKINALQEECKLLSIESGERFVEDRKSTFYKYAYGKDLTIVAKYWTDDEGSRDRCRVEYWKDDSNAVLKQYEKKLEFEPWNLLRIKSYVPRFIYCYAIDKLANDLKNTIMLITKRVKKEQSYMNLTQVQIDDIINRQIPQEQINRIRALIDNIADDDMNNPHNQENLGSLNGKKQAQANFVRPKPGPWVTGMEISRRCEYSISILYRTKIANSPRFDCLKM